MIITIIYKPTQELFLENENLIEYGDPNAIKIIDIDKNKIGYVEKNNSDLKKKINAIESEYRLFVSDKGEF